MSAYLFNLNEFKKKSLTCTASINGTSMITICEVYDALNKSVNDVSPIKNFNASVHLKKRNNCLFNLCMKYLLCLFNMSCDINVI